MRFLEFRDMNNILQVVPLFKSFFSSISYPLTERDKVITAQLFTNDNRVVSISGNDFKIVNINGGDTIE